MSIDWGKFDHEEGEAWGNGGGKCPAGEYNAKITSAVDEGGILTVNFAITEPEIMKGRSIKADYVTSAEKSGKSERAEEVTTMLLKGMMRAAKVPKGSYPSKWVGLELGIEVADSKDDRFSEVRRYSAKINGPLGMSAAKVKPAEAFDDDAIPF